MSIPSVKVGRPLESSRRGLTRSRLRWKPGGSAPGERSSKVLSLSLARKKPTSAAAARDETPPLAHISDGPLRFLSIGHFFALAAAALVTVLLILGMVRANHASVSYSYEISELTEHKLNLMEINRQLKTELAQVSSLAQLEEIARETLGLVVPSQGQIVVIE
ncbi:MAG: cell division protein FtsL [Candidatus Adiutrix sp.]|jgi:cell division protein FtsL|nr:cell division protein FtsL [Candidatus Adiutrix sp.]